MFKKCKFGLDEVICSIRFQFCIQLISLSHKVFDGIIDPWVTIFWSTQFSRDSFSDRSLRAFLNKFHLSFVFILADYWKKSLWYSAMSDLKPSHSVFL